MCCVCCSRVRLWNGGDHPTLEGFCPPTAPRLLGGVAAPALGKGEARRGSKEFPSASTRALNRNGFVSNDVHRGISRLLDPQRLQEWKGQTVRATDAVWRAVVYAKPAGGGAAEKGMYDLHCVQAEWREEEKQEKETREEAIL